MEIAALQRLIKRWRDNPSVIRCAYDCYAKGSKAIRDIGWEIAEHCDLNHIVKAFDRNWQQTPIGQLRGLQIKLKKWFLSLTYCTYSPDQREEYWLNTLEHFRGNHANCPVKRPNLKLSVSLANNVAGQEQSRIFLSQTAKLVWQMSKDLSRQRVPSCNSTCRNCGNSSCSLCVACLTFSNGPCNRCESKQRNKSEGMRFEGFRFSRSRTDEARGQLQKDGQGNIET
jgi:hypothetical protein